MGCGASKKSTQCITDAVNASGVHATSSPAEDDGCAGSVADTESNQAEVKMMKKAKASNIHNGSSTPKNTVEQKIQSYLSIPEDDAKAALSLAAKHPDSQDEFSHLVNIMHLAVKSDPLLFVGQLNGIDGLNESTTSIFGADLIDFLALIGGAKTTVEVYADQLKRMNVTHLTDQLLQEELDEKHETALSVIRVMRDFWVNATDHCSEFADRLLEAGVLSFLKEDLKNLEENFEADSAVFEVSITILYNCARSGQKKHFFLDIGAVQLLTRFLAREEKDIKLVTLLALSYIIDEDENHLLIAEASDFDFFLETMCTAYESEDHRESSGYSLEELLEGLGNLAQNDDNKKLLMKKDVLVLLKPMLETGSEAEKQKTAQIIWNLAFDKENRKTMGRDWELMELLNKLKDSSHRGVAKSCSGALWVLNLDRKVHQGQGDGHPKGGPPPAPPLPEFGGPFPPHAFSSLTPTPSSSSSLVCFSPPPAPTCLSASPPPPPPPPGRAVPPPAPLIPTRADLEGKGHVMVSYQWGSQKMVLQIRDSLRSQGFRVWMDVDNISGSTLQAMAEAVEQADAVLMCMSERYKNSPNCRTEAEYAFALHKPIIPLLMERNYKPDGWLGILRGSKLFFDFSGKYPYEKKLEELVKELGQRGRGGSSEVDGPVRAETVAPVASTPPKTIKTVSSWSQEDVHNWLNKHQLGGCQKLQSLSGENIKFLQKLSQRAPEFFFTYLKQDLGLTSLMDLMHFSDAIDSLP
ncbi:uncharacterized protein LOC143282413 [Babylonia areolata]|uniref:uncharacterized protein LOC143282413 n=1 Tax=Babylonia areolata TaxID=304850 RepID=UPI003FD47E3B